MRERLTVVVPLTVAIIAHLLYVVFRRVVLASLPFALVGGVWLVWAGGFNVSVGPWR